ncbi:unnamed protein product [marine sediment metagenome]|uniref:Uncharacterized protein n=1 Tax=marine sediment metagenome TaxID=412755 RepID=X1L945_9ZZZZ
MSGSKAKILMISVLSKSEIFGGITAVVRTFLNSSLVDKYSIKYISMSPLVGSKTKKFLCFVWAILVFIYKLLI